MGENSLLPQNQTEAKAPQGGAQIVTKLEALEGDQVQFNLDDKNRLVAICSETPPVNIASEINLFLDKRDPAVYIKLTGNSNFTSAPVNVVDGQRYIMMVEQDATGGHTLVSAGSQIVSEGGPLPIGITANEVSMLTFVGFRSVLVLESIVKNLQNFQGNLPSGWPAATP